jgi:ethanolamine utilization protein EutN
MRLGEVIGKVVATRKDPSLTGCRLLIVQPLDHAGKKVGRPLIAADVVSCGQGETVYWVSAREAPNALPSDSPVDAAIVGISDRIDVNNL